MIDFLIIGQGLAGSLLAWELIQRGCKVIVVDNGIENASQIAAGLINPITGMRFVKSTDVDILLPAAKEYYLNLEDFFQEAFFIEKPMLRIFNNPNEVENAEKRLLNTDYQNYIGNIQAQSGSIQNLSTPYGYLEQLQTGYLLTHTLLDRLKAFFISNNSYRQADFEYQDLLLKPSLHWQDLLPRQLIFCEGYQAMKNPWFSWLPFQPVKGEILTLQHESSLPDKILNFGNWLIPLNNHQIKIGATFDRENLNTESTEQGKIELYEALGNLSPVLKQSILLNHQANIRPCTLDRQPFIGRHPEYDQLAIFNGFGAKGSLQMPWYAKHFADHLLTGIPLSSSVNIMRHYEKHFSPSIHQ
ncbi:MAG: FAD-binding oxidoreductase [Mariniphaga sp.]